MESTGLPSAQGEQTPPPTPQAKAERKLTTYYVFIWKDGCLRPLTETPADNAPLLRIEAAHKSKAIEAALAEHGQRIAENPAYGAKGTAVAVPVSNLHSEPYELNPPEGWNVKLG